MVIVDDKKIIPEKRYFSCKILILGNWWDI